MVAIVSTRPSLGDRPDERPRTTRPGSRWRRPVASPNSGSCRDHRGHRRRRSGFTAARYARCDRRRARRRRQPARPELGARRRHRYHAGGRQHRRRSQRDPPFDRARVGPSRQELFPQAKLGIGPPITDGFYYDFDVPEPFTPEDLAALEKRMRQIVKEGQLFDRRVYESTEQARAELANEPYKLELVDDKSGDAEIMEVGGDELTAYDNLNPAPASASGATCAADRTSRPPNTSRRSSSPAARPPTGRAIRKTPACNGSTAPRGNPRRRSTGTWSSSKRRSAATTASWVSSWTCSASPTKSVPA